MTRFLDKLAFLVGDSLFLFLTAALVLSVLGVDFLNSANWPTGGDSASHVLYAWLYAEELLFSGHALPWLPEVFGGLPFLSYYFPLPFIVIAVLSKIVGFAPAFKWSAFLATSLLPGLIFIAGRRWLRLPWIPAFFGGLGSLAFVLHEQNSIWGGNLLSTLAGEFAYSYGLLFAVLATMAWIRAVASRRGWILAGVLEAACGFSHGFPLLVVGFSTVFLLLESRNWANFRAIFQLLARGHLLAFGLLGGWLWPMLEMHGLTIPNDASFHTSNWHELLPTSIWPVGLAGIGGVAALAIPSVRQSWGDAQTLALRYFTGSAGVAALGFVVGDQIGLADIRFFPLVWLFGAMICGWLFGQALGALGPSSTAAGNGYLQLAHLSLVAAACLGLMGWLGEHVHEAPDWSQWNHSGLDAKPQWHNLSKLFPAMSGSLWSPRLLFEHDPANDDIGSTRTLEALPMFLNHRPVLEGLYMESALIGPAVYQVQSEVSTRPSSPLARFPGSNLDPQFAAEHMNFLHADTLLLRSETAKAAFRESGLFECIAERPPFALYRLRRFDSHLAEVVTKPIKYYPAQDWMENAFVWFRTRSLFSSYLPVYGDRSASAVGAPTLPSVANVQETMLTRDELVFVTSAVGRPHLIKVAFHPRWHLVSKGSLHIAAPGFMLVVPDENQIRLAYGHTVIGKLGMLATLTAVFFLVIVGWRHWHTQRFAGVSPNLAIAANTRPFHWTPLIFGWGTVVVIGVFFSSRSPERAYEEAWVLMNAKQYEDAGAHFLTAYQLRRPPAKKEEALFWLAKASELAGRDHEAKTRYRELCERFQGYWLPESLYTLAMMERRDRQQDSAERYIERLRHEFPASPWTKKLDHTN